MSDSARSEIQLPWGQIRLCERISGALAGERFPQSLLIHGPEGVGKQSMALWIAASLQCNTEGGPCGTCRSCRLAARLEHPDIHLHFPMPRPKRASSSAKLREAIETQRQERLATLRQDPAAVLDEGEATGIYVAAIHTIREQASRRPAMTNRAVFVVSDADRMVPQAASQEAANAFLKLLEEPPLFAYIILTTNYPELLLPTIRSRTVSLRIPPISEDEVNRYLTDELNAPAADARNVARRSEGVVGRAKYLLESDTSESQRSGERLLAAALEKGAEKRYQVASEYSARGARAILQPALEELRIRLRDVMCESAGAEAAILDPTRLRVLIKDQRVSLVGAIQALSVVDDALDSVTRNMNPQSTVSVLLKDMNNAFSGAH
jgi:DNA polymerase-3 subunit delta'